MSRKYQLSWTFHDTLAEAEAEARERNRSASAYQRRERPAYAVRHPWQSGGVTKYVCFYYYKNW